MTDELMRRFEPLWGEWKIGKALGEGSYGQVWELNRETSQGKQYAAVKGIQVPPSFDSLITASAEGLNVEGAKVYYEGVLQHNLKEIELMRRLSPCGHIVHFEDYLVEKLQEEEEFGWVILIRMEKLESLKSRILNGKIDVYDVRKLGIHLCRALEACAQQGVIHRDMKPDNIFYSEETDSYKLGDFGIACLLERPTQGKGRAGTLTHMSPEVFQGAPFTPKDDLYALGMILYRLLNDNRVPFLPEYPEAFTPKQRDQALVRRLQGEEPDLPRAVRLEQMLSEHPAEAIEVKSEKERFAGPGAKIDRKSLPLAAALGKIAARAIAAKPEKRYASAQMLRKELEKLL